jgi:hypothetical protein
LISIIENGNEMIDDVPVMKENTKKAAKASLQLASGVWHFLKKKGKKFVFSLFLSTFVSSYITRL